MDRGFKCQKHLMNGEVTSVKTSQESSEIISIALKILSIFPGTHFLKKLMMFFFLSDKSCLQCTVDVSYLHFLCWVLEVS